MGWDIWEDSETVHVFPPLDVNEHVFTKDCICNPTVEYYDDETLEKYKRIVIVHNSYDGRELNEWDM